MASPNDEEGEITSEEKLVEAPATETSAESSTEEQTVSEETSDVSETPEKAEKLAEAEDLTEEERKRLSVKAQKRFSKLSKKAKRADELDKEVRILREGQERGFTAGFEPASMADRRPVAPPVFPWEEGIEKGQSQTVTPEEYRRNVLTTADWLVKARIGQADTRRDKVVEVKTDLVEVQRKYSNLDPKSENFDKDLSTKLATLYNNQLKADPRAKLLDFVNTVMDVRKGGKEEGQAEAQATLSEQKAEEALTPSTAEVEEAPVNFEELGLEEQEKYLKDHGLWEK